LVSPVPSALIFQISRAFGAVLLFVTKIKRLGLVGDQRGAKASFGVTVVTREGVVPSAFIL